MKVEEQFASSIPEPPAAAVKLSVCNEQMQSLQENIKSKTTNLTTSITSDNTITNTTLQLLKDMLDSVKTSLSSDFSTLAQEIMNLDSQNIATRCTEFETFRRAQQSIIDKFQTDLALKTSVMSSSASVSSVNTNIDSSMTMEKGKTPSFSGKTLEYPEFKRAWQKVPGKRWSDENQVEQIKFNVDSNTKRIITRCDTMNEVWTALDAEYAQEEDVVNAVDVELKKLRMTECTIPQYIVDLRNHLPNLEHALKSVNGLDHLCSPARVNFLCTKFDERTLHDWDYFRSKCTDGNT